MADATAQLNNYRQAPRKVRLLADLVRGKSASTALGLLSVLPKRASEPFSKLIRSAVSNADAKAEDLYISRVEVNGGVVLKRSMPRARGRAAQILKRTSHISLSLSKKAPAKTKAPKKAAKAKVEAEPAEAETN